MDQAKHLKLDLMMVPLPSNCSNEKYVANVTSAVGLIKQSYNLMNERQNVRLVFGDLHLDDVKQWRMQSFSGYHCHFPLFGVNSEELLRCLWSLSRVSVVLSAVSHDSPNFPNESTYPTVGSTYNRELVHNLPKGWDPMGERGEFHTRVIFL